MINNNLSLYTKFVTLIIIYVKVQYKSRVAEGTE